MDGEVRSKAITNGIVLNVDDTIGIVMYAGFALRETAGATAVVRVRQGTVTGLILDTIALAANESASDLYPVPMRCEGDLYCEVVSGTVEGSLRFA